MPRDRQRACLQDGIKLDINSLARRGFICRDALTRNKGIKWTNPYWGDIASAIISADMSGECEGWFDLRGGLTQHIRLIAHLRPYGGRQWYFMCPSLNRPVSVLWRPPGATRFASRQSWGRQVAYQSQFLDRDSRAHHVQSKIKNKLCDLGGFDPEDWDLPPRPKWMRQRTYARIEAQFDQQDAILDEGHQCTCRAIYGGLKTPV